MAENGQNAGSVLFKSLADGLQGIQQGLQQKRQNDLQNLMTALKVQDAEMNREAFLQSQQLREQQMQNAQQTFKKNQIELNRLADPIGTARREAEAQAAQQAVFNQAVRDQFLQSQDVPIPLVGQDAMNFAQESFLSNLQSNELPFDVQLDPLTGVPTKVQMESPSASRMTDFQRKVYLMGEDVVAGRELSKEDLKNKYLSFRDKINSTGVKNRPIEYINGAPSFSQYLRDTGLPEAIKLADEIEGNSVDTDIDGLDEELMRRRDGNK